MEIIYALKYITINVVLLLTEKLALNQMEIQRNIRVITIIA